MSLLSHDFLLVFLPLTLFLYYRLFKTSRSKMFFLLFTSILFYALAGWQFLPVMLALSVSTFIAAKKGWFLPGILGNLAVLGLFKYWNFGLTNFNAIMAAANIDFTPGLLSLGLPLGITFFVFKHIGYLRDIQNKRYQLSNSLWTFLAYSAYFPQISAGPISSYDETATSFSNLPERLGNEEAVNAIVHLSFGLAKKVLIADQIGLFLASSTNTIPGFAGFIPSWYIVIAYAARLYFDFSGYTDMALGVSALLGVKLPHNFNSPYLAADPAGFWERWHISLSSWFRYYLFTPLGRWLLLTLGSSRREIAQYGASLITMALIGLWHGAGWTYILWGVYHGILLNIHTWWRRTGLTIPTWLSRPAFLICLLAGWGLFMSPDLPYMRHLFAGLTGWRGGLGDPGLLQALWHNYATPSLLAGILLAFSGHSEAVGVLASGRGVGRWRMLAWGVLAALAILFIHEQINFIYVQF